MAVDGELRAAHSKLLSDFQLLNQPNAANVMDAVSSQLALLKVMLAERELLYPQPQPDGLNVEALLLARDVFEIGTLASIHAKDTDSFDRYWNQLKPFYLDLQYVVCMLTQCIPSCLCQLRADRGSFIASVPFVKLHFVFPYGS